MTAFFPESATHKQKKLPCAQRKGKKAKQQFRKGRKKRAACRSVAPKRCLPDSPSFLFPPRSCLTLRRFSQTQHSPSSSPDEEGETILSPSLLKNLVFHKQTERDREGVNRKATVFPLSLSSFLPPTSKPCFPAWLASSFSP